MQEYCEVKEQTVVFDKSKVIKNANVRPMGSQVHAGEQVLAKEVEITSGIIGYLASLGIREVAVYAKPKVSLLITGNELVGTGKELKFGQIYESNSSMLQAALKEGGIEVQNILFAKDTLEDTVQSIGEAIDNTNFLLITGGISVGDYDFVQQALDLHRVKKVFYKLKQKPGKPLYFGIKDKTYVFALPGNPSSVLTCFYEYVIPAIRKFCGRNAMQTSRNTRALLHDYTKKGDLTHFLKALSTTTGVTILGAQESYKLNSFTEANCLVMIESDRNELKKGELVEVHFLKELWYE
jgi:molybdopterin molybdotransferase